MMGIRRRLLAGALAVLALMLSACESGEVKSAWSDSLEKDEGKLRVVTTVAPLSDITRNIGGDRIALRGLIPNGVDSHTFEPKPSDARLLAKADLIILNGLHLEEPTLKLAEANKKQGTEIKLLGENTITDRDWLFDFSFPKEAGDPNPHLWMNPKHALRYAELINTWLAEKDPSNKDYYAANLEKYRALLNQLDAGIREAVKTVPEKNRKLVTYHDSWAYWAKEYGWTVIGAVQPSDFKEPRPQEVAGIIDQIKQEQVPAIFGSEVYPSKVLKQIAKEGGATYYDKLRDDDPPGKPSAKNHTYVGMVLADMQIMLTALGGNTSALQSINPERVYASGQ
jgi:ABC-type Zn uptake system ZnuABC Zn-binding protein ZnuA